MLNLIIETKYYKLIYTFDKQLYTYTMKPIKLFKIVFVQYNVIH